MLGKTRLANSHKVSCDTTREAGTYVGMHIKHLEATQSLGRGFDYAVPAEHIPMR